MADVGEPPQEHVGGPAAGTTAAMLPASPRRHRRPLCVAMATSGGADGVWSTIQSICLFHPEVADEIAFLVVESRPGGAASADVEALADGAPAVRYVPFAGGHGAGVRNMMVREASADIVCCVDPHVLIAPGALAAILAWFGDHRDSRDLLQGPLLADDLDRVLATHLRPDWGSGAYGTPAVDERITAPGAQPFEIGMQDTGLFACRRAAWPVVNPRFRGSGGEHGYLHEKFRRAGGRVLCHPAVGWARRPATARQRPDAAFWQDTVRNHRIGHSELGWDDAPIDRHFAAHLRATGADPPPDRMLAATARQAANPLAFFDAIFCLNLDGATRRWSAAARRHARLDIAWQVERFPGTETPDDPHRGIAISFRRMIAEAQRRGYEHLLVLEDDAVFLDDALDVMRAVTADLDSHRWDLCFLGACVWGEAFPSLGDSTVLQVCGPVTCTHAVAFHRDAYARLLAEIPTAADELDDWLDEYLAIDQYLSRAIADARLRAVITSPRVASQPNLLDAEDGDGALAARYVI